MADWRESAKRSMSLLDNDARILLLRSHKRAMPAKLNELNPSAEDNQHLHHD
jgi:hypothetical protein